MRTVLLPGGRHCTSARPSSRRSRMRSSQRRLRCAVTVVLAFALLATAAVSAQASSVYATDFSGATVAQFSATETGGLSALSPATVGAGSGTSEIVVSPDGKSAYAVNGSTVSQYDIQRTTGGLSPKSTATVSLPTTSTGGSAQAWGIALSPDGKNAYVTDTALNRVSQFDVDAQGLHAKASPTPATIVSGAAPRGITVSPDGTSVYVAAANNIVVQ